MLIAAHVRALASYKDFLTLWKDADPDIPILEASKDRVHEVTVSASLRLAVKPKPLFTRPARSRNLFGVQNRGDRVGEEVAAKR